MEDKKEAKYYCIRASVFWIGFIVAVLLFAILIISILKPGDTISEQTDQNERVEKEHMEFGSIQSELKNEEECYLCGNSERSLMGYYRKFDTIGVIGLNEWYVLDLRLKKYDGKGNVETDQGGTSMSGGNNLGMDYDVDATPSRGMATATFSSTNEMFDEKTVQENLCQICLDKVTDTLEGYFEKGKEEYLPFCLVDFETLDIYPMQKMNRAYFVRDYWVELEYEDSEIEVNAYYLPEREF